MLTQTATASGAERLEDRNRPANQRRPIEMSAGSRNKNAGGWGHLQDAEVGSGVRVRAFRPRCRDLLHCAGRQRPGDVPVRSQPAPPTQPQIVLYEHFVATPVADRRRDESDSRCCRHCRSPSNGRDAPTWKRRSASEGQKAGRQRCVFVSTPTRSCILAFCIFAFQSASCVPLRRRRRRDASLRRLLERVRQRQQARFAARHPGEAHAERRRLRIEAVWERRRGRVRARGRTARSPSDNRAAPQAPRPFLREQQRVEPLRAHHLVDAVCG